MEHTGRSWNVDDKGETSRHVIDLGDKCPCVRNKKRGNSLPYNVLKSISKEDDKNGERERRINSQGR